MTYAETIRREMAWTIRTMRLCMGWKTVDPWQKEELIQSAEKNALKKIEIDLDGEAITKRQASAGRKAIKDFKAKLEELPIKK